MDITWLMVFTSCIVMTFCWGKKREGGPNPCCPHLPVMNLSAACCLKCSPECLSVLSLAIIINYWGLCSDTAGVYNKPILRTVGNNDDGNIIHCISEI